MRSRPTTITLAAQALAIRDQGHPDEALPLLERALRIREKALGPEHRTVARTLTEVAATERLLGRIPDAQRRSERALRIWAAAGSPDAHDYATAVALSAELALLRGDVAAALRESQRAMSIEERVFERLERIEQRVAAMEETRGGRRTKPASPRPTVARRKKKKS